MYGISRVETAKHYLLSAKSLHHNLQRAAHTQLTILSLGTRCSQLPASGPQDMQY